MPPQIRFYNAKGHDRTLTAKELPKVRITRASLLWVNATEADVHELTLPSAMRSARQVTALEEPTVLVNGEQYCVAIPVLTGSNGIEVSQLDMVVGQDWLITFGDEAAIDCEMFVKNEVGETMKGKLSGSTFAAALIAEHIRRFHDRIAMINCEIDRIEERILTGRESRNTLKMLAVLRRQVSRLRDLTETYRPIVHTLNRPDFLPQLDQADKAHFAHLQAGYERLEDEIARVRETVVASFELYATRIAQETNRLVRTLTLFTIGIGLIGALAGVLGMNFKLAFFERGASGFILAVGIMISILFVTVGIALFSYRKP
jgi:Mg2+ and Co2+ transporter CorA